MKKICIQLAVFACSFVFSQANANNSYCCPQSCNPCFDQVGFEGFYLGGNLGVSGHEMHRRDIDGFLTDNSGWSGVDLDVTVGVQIGYDWQCNSSLVGLVVDWNWVGNSKTFLDNPNAGNDNRIENDFDWFTTIRGRAGLTVCDALVYLTAGAAVARFETTWIDSPDSFKFDDTRWGWTGGMGVEFLVVCNFSLGAEVLYTQFPDRTKTFTSASSDQFAFGHSESIWVGRVILNYRFGDLCSLCCR